MKKRVITFFGFFIVIAGILLFLQMQLFGSITGFVASSKEQYGNNGADSPLALSIVSASYSGYSAAVSYSISGVSSAKQKIDVAYSVQDSSGKTVNQGEMSIVLDSRNSGPYSMRVAIPSHASEPLLLILSVSDGDRIAYQRVSLSKGVGITGSTIQGQNASFSAIGFLLVAFFIAGYVSWYAMHRKRIGALSEGIDGRFIKLRDLSH